MIVAIHQPNYLPWMGYFDKMSKSDIFVIFDDVQLPRGGHSFETRCVINSGNGPLELNIPVENRGGALIKDTRIVPGRWRTKHLKSITLNYPKAHGFLDELADVYRREWTMLLEFNVTLIRMIAGWLGIEVRIILSSELSINVHGTEKILGIVEALGADTYISGTGAGSRRYVNEEIFASRGVKLVWHNFNGPNWSVVDSLFGGASCK